MIIEEILGIIFGGLLAILTAIRKFDIRHIKIKCLSGCCECEEDMGSESESESDSEHEKEKDE